MKEISVYDLCYSKKPFALLKKWANKQVKDGHAQMKFEIEYDEYGGKFWKFKWNTHSHLCRVKKLKDCTAVIVDELKEIFGLSE